MIAWHDGWVFSSRTRPAMSSNRLLAGRVCRR
ncbi:MAG: hypothetical protein KatS3mg103_0399 [Phycisphaerales bacterium]|nr:MAG: hypothetical protein KatS3mg103_0399 [Phycisphaerales bacterium]